MKRLGLVSVLGIAMLAAPIAAWAGEWHGGGGGWRGRAHVGPAPAGIPRGGPVYRHAPHVHVRPHLHVRPSIHVGVVPHARVWAPGQWGHAAGARVWVGANWAYPPYPGWVWIAPRWAWNGYGWIWEQGYWAPPGD